MEKKRTISQYRDKLDKTLASDELTNSEMLKTLVKNQILRHDKEEFSENLLDKRTQEVSNFLDMLRSASVKDHQVPNSSEALHGEWKLKHDNEEFRVMYREGPHGTPLHTLLVEGYVDGPLDVCLCISWESALYKKWWPQSSFPSFKVTSSTCLQSVRIGEQISLVRMKVAWPLSAREALVHYFFFEYFQDDLIVILLNTISDTNTINKASHGFTSDGIPEAKDVVRIDAVGGFALQKVTNERSYFRTIANMDLKLDFVPPSLINFISRQLVGNGFRLYQKTVASVSNHDDDYSKALENPLYSLIREALYSGKKPDEVLKVQEFKKESCQFTNEHLIEHTQDGMPDTEQKVFVHDHAGETPMEKAQVTKRKAFGEIEEEVSEESTCPEDGDKAANQLSTTEFVSAEIVNSKKKISIRPEVEQALETLEKAIALVQRYGFRARSQSSGLSNEEPPTLEDDDVENIPCAADGKVSSKVEVDVEAASKKVAQRTSHDSKNSSDINDTRSAGSNSLSREANYNKVAPASPQPNASIPTETNHVALNLIESGNIKANGIHENGVKDVRKLSSRRNNRFACFGFCSGSS